MKADAWVSSSALVGRMNFAVRLSSGKMRGVRITVPAPAINEQPWTSEQALISLETTLLEGDVSNQTHETVASRLQDPAITRRRFDDPALPPGVAMIEG